MFWKDSKRSSSQTPLPNTYWVEPGRLLAGEYPGSMSRAEALERIETLLKAGITSFIDLTEEGELPEYEPLLSELTEQRIHYRRLPVLDHGVPDSPAHMGQIVDAIEGELQAGRCLYVHCRAGIGRTGMAIACYLVRGGLANQEALEQLQTLWRRCERSRRWPSVPETEDQVEFVRKWRDAARHAAAAPLHARAEGALIGLALGDALGALASTAAFEAATIPSAGPGLQTGVHTASTCALADSLLARGKHDPADQMHRYLQWSREAQADAVPGELRRALAAWQWSRKPNAGTHDPKNLDAHSLPRTLAVALFLHAEPPRAIEAAANASRTTQQAPIVVDLCRVWAAQLTDALHGVSRQDLSAWSGPAMQLVRHRQLKPRVKALLNGRESGAASATDAIAVSSIAVAAFSATQTFRDALLSAATRRAPPAAAALCGALSGAHYALAAIPLDWRQRLAEDAVLRSLAQHLIR